MTLLSAQALSFRYGDRQILRDLTFSLCVGEMVGITGASGSGKSTLLSCLSGLVSVKSNNIISCNNMLLSSLSDYDLVRAMGLVSQNPQMQLFFETVEAELVFGMENLAIPPEEMPLRMQQTMEAVGLTCSLSTHPKYLSGGEQQLLVLACALCLQPRILLLDESLSMVSATRRAHVLARLHTYAQSGCGIVMVSHHADVLASCDRVLTLVDGKLLEVI